MNDNPHEDNPDGGDTVGREAALWVIRMDRGSLSQPDQEALAAWRALSPRHAAALDEAAGVWRGLDRLREIAQPPVEDGRPPPKPKLKRWRMRVRGRWAAGVAAAIVLATLLLAGLPMLPPQVQVTSVYSTAVGEQQAVTLADGSKLLLNTDSAVEADLGADRRVVRLLRGEVHFDVVPEKSRPFSVFAGSHIVTATGTAFVVARHSEDIEVTVTEGGVAVYASPDRSAQRLPKPDPTPVTRLVAGEAATVNEAGGHAVSITASEMERKLAWRQGLLVFSGEPLEDVVAEVGRYTNLEIIIEDPSLRRKRFGGQLRIGNIDTLVNALEQSFGVRVERRGDTAVYLSAAAE